MKPGASREIFLHRRDLVRGCTLSLCEAGPAGRGGPVADLPGKDLVMLRKNLLRTAAAAALAAILLMAPAVNAQGLASHPIVGEGSGLLTSLLAFLSDLFPASETLDTRCTIDPNGAVTCGNTGAQLDTRCTIDPDGRTSCTPDL